MRDILSDVWCEMRYGFEDALVMFARFLGGALVWAVAALVIAGLVGLGLALLS